MAAMLLMGSAASADFVIDGFQSNQLVQVVGPPPGVQTAFNQLADGGVAGGYRDIKVTRVSSNAGQVSGDSNESYPGRFSTSTSSNTSGAVELQYDGNDNSPLVNFSGLGGISVLTGGADTFTLSAASDLGVVVRVLIYKNGTVGNDFAFHNFVIPGTGSTAVLQTYNFKLADFSTSGTFNKATDYNNVGAIVVRTSTSVNSADASIGLVITTRSVPEPGSFALMGLGLLGTGFAAYRRRKMAQ